jgi:hypothetical protein
MKAASHSLSPLLWRALLLLLVAAQLTNSLSLEAHRQALASRRLFLLLSSSSAVSAALPVQEAQAQALPRNIDAGGGFDLYSSTLSMKSFPKDVVYPQSIKGPWLVERIVTSMEGDAFQAETAWRSLGGSGDFRKTEKFLTKYLEQSLGADGNVDTVILDRGYERQARSSGTISSTNPNSESSSTVVWTPQNPDSLKTDKVEIAVVQRKTEPPTDEGFGYNELYRITEGPLFQRAARVQRRYRRAFDEQTGNRIIEGLEIQKTYRVLDGVAGTEFPTSTTKSMIRMKRPDQ